MSSFTNSEPTAHAGGIGANGYADAWQPTPEVPAHGGGAMPENADFFHAPPPEIGRIISAYSTLSRGKRAWSWVGRLLVMAAVTAVAAGFMVWAGSREHQRGDPPPWVLTIIFPTLAASVTFGLIAYFTRFQHSCSYVGELGVASYHLKGSRHHLKADNVLIFKLVEELRTTRRVTIRNGIRDAAYTMNWSDAAGKLCYGLGGHYPTEGAVRRKKQVGTYPFALAAELQWSRFHLARLLQRLKRDGFIHFNVKEGQWVRVGRGFLEFGDGDRVARIDAPDIKSMSLVQAKFHIAHKDATWFGSDGKYKFDYFSMANARLFVMAVEKLVGHRFN